MESSLSLSGTKLKKNGKADFSQLPEKLNMHTHFKVMTNPKASKALLTYLRFSSENQGF